MKNLIMSSMLIFFAAGAYVGQKADERFIAPKKFHEVAINNGCGEYDWKTGAYRDIERREDPLNEAVLNATITVPQKKPLPTPLSQPLAASKVMGCLAALEKKFGHMEFTSEQVNSLPECKTKSTGIFVQ